MIDKQEATENGFNILENTNKDAQKLEQLKKLIPNLVNSDKQLDITALEDFIDIANTTSNNKGYELTFAGKGLARAKADSETPFELKTETSQSKNFDQTKNAVIRGDNLEVLKILKQNYYGKIKMIYIDPPYNTKSENFIYNDDFKQNESDLLKTFGLDEEDEDDKNTLNFLHNIYGTRSHSGWLAFMYPRLKLARELLKEDGVIFISIDDNEQANLKILCDEIFGEENFVENYIWESNFRPDNSSKIERENAQHILCYAKEKLSINYFLGEQKKTEGLPSLTKNKGETYTELFFDKNFVEVYLKDGLYKKEKLNSGYELLDDVEVKDGEIKNNFRLIGKVIWSQKYLDEQVKLGTKIVIKTKGFIPYSKKIETSKLAPTTIIPKNFVGDVLEGNADIKRLFKIGVFTHPKPVTLLSYLLKSVITNSNDLILDFFAGSGTTGDAVMQLNTEDGGKRKFILLQWDEAIKRESEAHKFCMENNFEPFISSITLERLNRAGEKIRETNELVDIGYKVFSLTKKPKIIENEDGLFTMENQRSSAENTLINMLCATCKPLDSKMIELKKDLLYLVDDEMYLLGNIPQDELEEYKNYKINVDGWGDINLENWLNWGFGNRKNKENVNVVY